MKRVGYKILSAIFLMGLFAQQAHAALAAGSAIQNGAIIRLKHKLTGKYLHYTPGKNGLSGPVAPVTGKGEVCAWDVANSNENDNWIVQMQGSITSWTMLAKKQKLKLQHLMTGATVSASTENFDIGGGWQHVIYAALPTADNTSDIWAIRDHGDTKATIGGQLIFEGSYRLHSHGNKYSHQGGDNQQQVTGFEGLDDNDWWVPDVPYTKSIVFPAATLTITGAWYGAAGKPIQEKLWVLDQINTQFTRDSYISVPGGSGAMTAYFGSDPAAGQVKQLVIAMSYNNGKEIYFRANETDGFTFTYPDAQDLFAQTSLLSKGKAKPGTNVATSVGKVFTLVNDVVFPASSLTIVGAWYGAATGVNQQNISVLAQVNAQFAKDGFIEIPDGAGKMTAFVGKDPAPGQAKQLTIALRYNGKDAYFKANEADGFSFTYFDAQDLFDPESPFMQGTVAPGQQVATSYDKAFTLGETLMFSTGTLTVTGAWYGVTGGVNQQNLSVLNQVKAQFIKDGYIAVPGGEGKMTAYFGSDPVPGQTKQLVIALRYNGKDILFSANEIDGFTFNYADAQDLFTNNAALLQGTLKSGQQVTTTNGKTFTIAENVMFPAGTLTVTAAWFGTESTISQQQLSVLNRINTQFTKDGYIVVPAGAGAMASYFGSDPAPGQAKQLVIVLSYSGKNVSFIANETDGFTFNYVDAQDLFTNNAALMNGSATPGQQVTTSKGKVFTIAGSPSQAVGWRDSRYVGRTDYSHGPVVVNPAVVAAPVVAPAGGTYVGRTDYSHGPVVIGEHHRDGHRGVGDRRGWHDERRGDNKNSAYAKSYNWDEDDDLFDFLD